MDPEPAFIFTLIEPVYILFIFTFTYFQHFIACCGVTFIGFY